MGATVLRLQKHLSKFGFIQKTNLLPPHIVFYLQDSNNCANMAQSKRMWTLLPADHSWHSEAQTKLKRTLQNYTNIFRRNV